jgi:hypothetical protein
VRSKQIPPSILKHHKIRRLKSPSACQWKLPNTAPVHISPRLHSLVP